MNIKFGRAGESPKPDDQKSASVSFIIICVRINCVPTRRGFVMCPGNEPCPGIHCFGAATGNLSVGFGVFASIVFGGAVKRDEALSLCQTQQQFLHWPMLFPL